MNKAQETRERILKQAADLFNQYGYAGSSMSDIMRVTGLQKGGIYNHFKSKEELALLAFDYAAACLGKRFLSAIRGKRQSLDQLKAIAAEFATITESPPVMGGCPILNTAIESDDAHPVLRHRAQAAMDTWRSLICRIIDKGIKKGEIPQNIEADAIATIMISTLEGAVMMTKLYGDSLHMQRAIKHLDAYLESSLN
ncbi:TetR/AcrR family transcriptional regulator [Tumidithrix helvetica PCC 7403]|uniref:TetR/AcrR family transcriptional regulator n=1 Tax=Tumidithrix helvetica TaxID=3457545 RepID=UPI003CA0971B